MPHKLSKEVIPPKTCVGLPHKGPYNEIGNAFKKFFQELNESKSTATTSDGDDAACSGATTMDGKVLGLYLDNPEKTAPADLRSYAAMEIPDKNAEQFWPPHWETIHSEGGTAAVLTVHGSYNQLSDAWKSFAPRAMENGWKFSANPKQVPQEVYIEMDPQDESKNVTKLILFLED